jgi:hypothetical protein
MKRREFLKLVLGVPVAMSLPLKADKPCMTSKSASDRLRRYLGQVKNPRHIYVSSDIFSQLTDEFEAKCNYSTGYRLRLMYFTGLPIYEVKSWPDGMVWISDFDSLTPDVYEIIKRC